MINLEQVKLLETKVAKAIDYVERLAKENAVLHRQEMEWQTRLESYQKRIDELEVLVVSFKEDQGRIEEGILAALDRLSQFEKAIEKTLKDKPAGAKAARDPAAKAPAANSPQAASQQTASQQTAEAAGDSGNGQTCFEIPETTTDGDVSDPLEKTSADADTAPAEGGELDIF